MGAASNFPLHLRQAIFLLPATLVWPPIDTLISFPAVEEILSFISHLIRSAKALFSITFINLAFVPPFLVSIRFLSWRMWNLVKDLF